MDKATKRSEAESYPIVPFRSVDTDDRGHIWDILPKGVVIKSVLQIFTKSGEIRASHTHKKDNHYALIISGQMLYEWRQDGKLKHTTAKKGEMIYTPAGTFHRMTFLLDTVFLAFATQERSQANYEADTTRETIDAQI